MDAWRRAGTTSTGREIGPSRDANTSKNANTLPLGKGGGLKRGHPTEVPSQIGQRIEWWGLKFKLHRILWTLPMQTRFGLDHLTWDQGNFSLWGNQNLHLTSRHGFTIGNDQRALPNMLALPAPKNVGILFLIPFVELSQKRSPTDCCQSLLPLSLLPLLALMEQMSTAMTTCLADLQDQPDLMKICWRLKKTPMRFPCLRRRETSWELLPKNSALVARL